MLGRSPPGDVPKPVGGPVNLPSPHRSGPAAAFPESCGSRSVKGTGTTWKGIACKSEPTCAGGGGGDPVKWRDSPEMQLGATQSVNNTGSRQVLRGSEGPQPSKQQHAQSEFETTGRLAWGQRCNLTSPNLTWGQRLAELSHLVGGGCQVLLVKWGGHRVDGTKGGAVAGPRGGVSGVLRAGARLSGDHVCGFWEPGGLTVQRGAAG